MAMRRLLLLCETSAIRRAASPSSCPRRLCGSSAYVDVVAAVVLPRPLAVLLLLLLLLNPPPLVPALVCGWGLQTATDAAAFCCGRGLPVSRRDAIDDASSAFVATVAAAAGGGAFACMTTPPAAAAAASADVAATGKHTEASPSRSGLASPLAQRDASALTNRISSFPLPPAAQVHPAFLRGTWDVENKFAGYLFPSQSIPKETLVRDANIPGFQKCSVAAIADIGNETGVRYTVRIDPDTGLEDRAFNLQSSIDAYLG
jgi:hypothetical protein